MNNTNESFGRFDFVSKAWLMGGISAVLTVVAIVYLMVNGINYGIDFKGGTEVQVKFDQGVTIDNVRETMASLKLGEVNVQSFGEGNEYIIRFQGRIGATDKETNEMLNQDLAKVRETITKTFAANNPDIRRVDTVGPQVGSELKRNGVLSVFYCLLVILIYVSLRFDYKYAPGAVLCLFHDAVITLAVFVMVGKEVNIAILAAIMTLIGFSLNDTIVVYDRIREVEGEAKAKKITPFIINKSLNEMWARTLITAGSTFVSSIFLYIFADGTVEDIAFAISVGVFFGTYSSIYVAAPLILLMEKMNLKKANT